jgi:prepilin peptidase CpaA
MTPSQILLTSVLPLSACAALVDLKTGHIPNRLVSWGLVGGALLHVGLAVARPASPGLSLEARFAVGLAGSLGGVLCAAAVPYLLFRLRALGGGDVKLLAALGAALGPWLGLQVQLFAFILAALYAPLLLLYRGELWWRIRLACGRLRDRLRPREQRRNSAPPRYVLAFAPAVFAASLLLSGSHLWSW